MVTERSEGNRAKRRLRARAETVSRTEALTRRSEGRSFDEVLRRVALPPLGLMGIETVFYV